jgi:hypothetical protein
MTLILELSPDREAALQALAQARGVSAEQYALQLLDRDLKPSDRPRRHISEVICEIMSDVPPEAFEALPRDGASEHDHYLYGSPKRNS